MNKGHPMGKKQIIVFIDKWSLKTNGLFLEVNTLYYFIKEELLKCGPYLHSGHWSEMAFIIGLYLQGGLYLETPFNTGLTVFA